MIAYSECEISRRQNIQLKRLKPTKISQKAGNARKGQVGCWAVDAHVCEEEDGGDNGGNPHHPTSAEASIDGYGSGKWTNYADC
jgi:hypothetical protein